MKYIIYIIMALLTLGMALGEITGSETIDRETPASAIAGETFQVTYRAAGTSGQWGASIEDSVSGGCTFPSGSSSYKTVMLSEDGNTKTITMTAGSSTCVFVGDYKFGTFGVRAMTPDSVSVSGTCTPNCNNRECGLDTCGQNSCGTCSSGEMCQDYQCIPSGTSCGDGSCNGAETCSNCQTDCGTCPTGACEFWEEEVNGQCELNIMLAAIGGLALLLLLKK